MIPANSLLTERLAVLATILPVALSTSAASSTLVNLVPVEPATGTYAISTSVQSYFQRFLGIVLVGPTPGTGVITATLVKSTTTDATNATAVLTCTTATGTSATGVYLLEFNGVQIDTAATYIGLRVASTSGGVVAGVLLGGDGRADPASYFNLAAGSAGGVVSSKNN